MRLKVATTALMVTGLVLMACWPLIMGQRPPADAPRQALRDYAFRSATYFCVLIVIFFAAIVCAWLVLRQTRVEFAERSMENLQNLIEGTLKDHADPK